MDSVSSLPWAAPMPSAVEPKFSHLLLAHAVAAAIPLMIALHWYCCLWAPALAAPLLRGSVFALTLIFAAIWYRAPLSRAEGNLLKALAFAAIAWILPCLTAGDVVHAASGWIKLLSLFTLSFLAARGLRHNRGAQVFGVALLVTGILLVALILSFYLSHQGFVLPSYKTAREFKGAASVAGLSLNSVAFSAVFSYLCGLCLLPIRLGLIAGAVSLSLIASFFSGSRAPLFVLSLSLVVFFCVRGWSSSNLYVRLASAAAGGLLLVTVIGSCLFFSDAAITRATEGRWHLWSVGMRKFAERPFTGYGYESWREDLISRLPGEADLTVDLATHTGGAYHNQYVTLLAEEGLVGALAAASLLWLALRYAYLLSLRRWFTYRSGACALFTCLFLILRANFEVPGLFGYQQDTADYLAYIFIGILVSRFSAEQDWQERREFA